VLLALALRILTLGIDARFHPDEALFAAQARLISHEGDWLLRSTDLDKPPLTLYITALSFRLLGPTEFAARLPNVLLSGLSVALAYRLAQTLYRDRTASLLAALLCALSPYLLAFAPTAFTDGQATSWVLLAALLAARNRWGWAGGATALAFAAKTTALWAVPLIVALGLARTARPAWRGRDVLARLARYALPLLAGIALLVLWDLGRTPRSFFSLGYARNNPGRLIRSDELWLRLEAWGHWLGFATESPALNALLAALVPAWLATRLAHRLRTTSGASGVSCGRNAPPPAPLPGQAREGEGTAPAAKVPLSSLAEAGDLGGEADANRLKWVHTVTRLAHPLRTTSGVSGVQCGRNAPPPAPLPGKAREGEDTAPAAKVPLSSLAGEGDLGGEARTDKREPACLFSTHSPSALSAPLRFDLSTPTRQATQDWIIAAYTVALLGWLWLVAFNTYDRYLHTLVPFALLLAARALIGAIRWISVRPALHLAMGAALVAAMLPGTLAALRGEAPLGGDQGTHTGIDALADYLNADLAGEIVTDHWLGWELAFYLGATPRVSVVYQPRPAALADELSGCGCRRYLVAPHGPQVAPWMAALARVGVAVTPVYGDAGGRFAVYRLDAPGEY